MTHIREEHERMEESGLLGGPLSVEAREAWPPWATDHLAVCVRCQRILFVDGVIRLQGLIRMLKVDTSHRHRNRAPPEPDALLDEDRLFLRKRYVADHGALELHRTANGVRVTDPDASSAAVYAISPDHSTRILAWEVLPQPGIALEVKIEGLGAVRVIAMTAPGHLDAWLWREWLVDTVHTDLRAPLAVKSVSDRLHVLDTYVGDQHGSSRLRTVPQVLAEADPTVRILLKGAAAFRRSRQTAAALRGYHAARVRAIAIKDWIGAMKAGFGLSCSAMGAGRVEEGRDILTETMVESTLDARWARHACIQRAWMAFAVFDFGEARAWLEEGNHHGGRTHWQRFAELHLAIWSEQPADVMALLDEHAFDDAASEEDRQIGSCMRSIALAWLGQLDEAQNTLPEPVGDRVGVRLWWWLARMQCDMEPQDPVPSIAQRLAHSPRSGISGFEIGIHDALVARLRRSPMGSPRASTMLRLRFLPVEDALDASVPALIATGSRSGLLASDPAYPFEVRHLDLKRGDVEYAVTRIRRSVAQGAPDREAIDTIRSCFLPSGVPAGEWGSASDGTLAGLPWSAVLATQDPTEPLPVLRHVLSPTHVTAGPAAYTTLVSMADADGDLPHAGREVERDEAAAFARGSAVTMRTLRSLREFGLLHVAVHRRRDRGVPVMVFWDGPVSPYDVSDLSLRGAPVVFLSGCAAGASSDDGGAERSLASAFLSAGASAVIATLWPVDDQEMFRLSRTVIEQWPFSSAPLAVARASRIARLRGDPCRVWASLVVYQGRPSHSQGQAAPT
jgi:hypothetical protein